MAFDHQLLAERVAAEYVHHLFPSFRTPAFVACPDDASAGAVIDAIKRAASRKRVEMEVVDLRPDPAVRLDGVTQRLCGFYGPPKGEDTTPPRILTLDGFDLLEGAGTDAPTYPFRSEFQFDEDYLWLFMGRDWRRLRRMFGSYNLPLYLAATDITPAAWRMLGGESRLPHSTGSDF